MHESLKIKGQIFFKYIPDSVPDFSRILIVQLSYQDFRLAFMLVAISTLDKGSLFYHFFFLN